MATVIMTAANSSIKVMGVTYHRGRTVEVSEELADKLCATGDFSLCNAEEAETSPPVTIEEELAMCNSAKAVKELAEKYDIDVSECKNTEQRKAKILAAFASI